MTFRLLRAPAETPVLLAAAKQHLRVDSNDQNALIQTYLDAAVQWIDGPRGFLGQALMAQAWAWDVDHAFPACEPLQIPMAPVLSVDAVTYIDGAGAETTLAADQYVALLERGQIEPAFGVAWPSTRWQSRAVTVAFTAGYENAAAVPAPIKAAILLKVGQLFANREPTPADERTIDNLLAPYRRWH